MTTNNEANQTARASHKATCFNCGGDRNCDIFGKYEERYDSEHFSAQTDWYLLKCQGCDYVFVQTISTNSEDIDYDYDERGHTVEEYNETKKYWPAVSKRKKPDWLLDHGIDAPGTNQLDKVILELYDALDNDLVILAAIGVRTTFDIASELLGVDPSLSFNDKLDALVTNRQIKSEEKERLVTIVEAGSASAHRGWQANPHELGIIVDILEHFLHDTFVAPARKKKLDEAAAKIKKLVPSREKKK